MPASAAPTNNGRFAPLGVLALTVVVFAAVVLVVTGQLRAGLREQALRRDAHTLAGVAAMQIENAVEALPKGVSLEEVPTALFVAVLRTSKFPGVLGVRIYDAQRRLTDNWILPPTAELPPGATWARLTRGDAVGFLHAGGSIDFDVPWASGSEPLIEAWVPLRRGDSGSLIGAAEFWVDGRELAADLAQHNRRLWLQAAVAWFVGSVVIVVWLSWAFRRLGVANRQLIARTEDLLRANRELVLAAKTSALGAVTAHLMHELKNPLAGLEVIMASQADAGGTTRSESGEELIAASELTRRLRSMVNDVVGVLRDEQTGARFELTAADILETVMAKMRGEAERRGVQLVSSQTGADVTLAGRRANLGGLVLNNLLHNALEATPAGGTVNLSARPSGDGGVEFIVSDGGGGLPARVRERLFQPCASSKVGGSGLGLALSYQLAQQARGRLELVRTDATGTSFRLVLAPEA